MCFLCSGKPLTDEPQNSKPSPAHDPGPGPVGFVYNPLPPSTGLNNEPQKQQKKVSKYEPPPMKFSKPSPKKFSPSPSPVNSDSDDTKYKKTSSPDGKLATSETTNASNPRYSTDHFPEWNSDSNKPTTRKTGHDSKLSPSPPPEKLNTKSTEPSVNITYRFPTSDDVTTHNTTESPTTKARDEQNAKASKTSSNNKKLMRNEKEHTEIPYKDAASSLHSQSDSEKDQSLLTGNWYG
ncbi:hypothetical protein FRX31_021634 [Thalictrum thalictroides]|uniref:Uncharacterized protein n=1 Tax=Thalictrum thalictroides TaxID=46969 RepID=A0A7J6VV87_THATH|nr:hypothetical protein FRX31_021634 [Thalictrum thalictroides]